MARSTYEEEVISKIAARTPQQWRSAFLKLWDEHKITKNQRKMLCVHYEAHSRPGCGSLRPKGPPANGGF